MKTEKKPNKILNEHKKTFKEFMKALTEAGVEMIDSGFVESSPVQQVFAILFDTIEAKGFFEGTQKMREEMRKK